MAMRYLDERPLADYVGEIAGLIKKGGFSTEEMATLRRMETAHPVPLVFYRVGVRHLPPSWDKTEDTIRSWVTILAGLAILGPQGYRSDIGLGRGLARAGYSEWRLERLLVSEGDTLRTLTLRAARFLAAKTQTCNWSHVVPLFFAQDPQRLERARLRIAKDYYRTLESEEK